MNEITSNNTRPAVAAFLAAGSELGRPKLPILKLTKAGAWVVGVDNAPATELRLVADVPGAEHGFTCFIAGKVVGEVMTPVALGKKVSQSDLPDYGPYQGGDGWRTSASIQLKSITTGEDFLFTTTSVGGRSAVGELLTKYARRLEAGIGGIPVIELAVEHYTHRLHGIVHNPVFRIVRWEKDTDSALMSGKERQADDAHSLAEELGDDDIPF
jgi:hypothetical protein